MPAPRVLWNAGSQSIASATALSHAQVGNRGLVIGGPKAIQLPANTFCLLLLLRSAPQLVLVQKTVHCTVHTRAAAHSAAAAGDRGTRPLAARCSLAPKWAEPREPHKPAQTGLGAWWVARVIRGTQQPLEFQNNIIVFWFSLVQN